MNAPTYNIDNIPESLAQNPTDFSELDDLIAAGIITNPDDHGPIGKPLPNDEEMQHIACAVLMHDEQLWQQYPNLMDSSLLRENVHKEIFRCCQNHFNEFATLPTLPILEDMLRRVESIDRRTICIAEARACVDTYALKLVGYTRKIVKDHLIKQRSRKHNAFILEIIDKPDFAERYAKACAEYQADITPTADKENPFWEIGYILSDDIPKPAPLIDGHLVAGRNGVAKR